MTTSPSSDTFVITGHRGAMAVEPENTLRSFRRAVADGADELELDVHLSRDGQMVVMHDVTVDRTTDGTGAIADKTWEEIRQLDAGQGERVPRLEQIWEEFSEIDLQVEVKAPAAAAAVLDLARRRPHRGSLTVTSFHPEAVAEAAGTDGPWRVGLIAGRNEADKITEHLTDGLDLMAHWELAELSMVREIRDSGRKVTVWASRTAEQVVRAMEEGWSGTTADDPGMAARARVDWLARTGRTTPA